MAVRQADIYARQRQLKQLERERHHLELEHERVAKQLSTVMGPRISTRERRVAKKQALLEKAEDDLARWKKLQEKYKAAAAGALEEKKRMRMALEVARQEAQRAEEEAQKSNKRYVDSTGKASRDVEAFKYAEAKL